jgi:pyruvate kinase
VEVPKGDLHDHMTHVTCNLAREIGARAIVAPTLTGHTARLAARHRPATAIVAVAAEEQVLRRLSLVWGVQAVPAGEPVHAGDDRLSAAVRATFAAGAVKEGDLIVLLAGHPIEGAEGFPTIRVARVGEAGRPREAG